MQYAKVYEFTVAHKGEYKKWIEWIEKSPEWLYKNE